MQIVAKVTLSNSSFEDLSAFFDSYKDKTLSCYQSEDYSFDIDLILNKGVRNSCETLLMN